MSATNRGTPRIAADLYETPRFCVDRLLERVPLPGGRWLEPCAGSGAIIRAVNQRRTDVRWYASELRTECYDELRPLVRKASRLWLGHVTVPFNPLLQRERYYDVIFTNPPYNQAELILRRCLPYARYTVMLLRLNYWGSEKRQQFLARHAPDTFVLPNRPPFVGGKTDATEYSWMLWHGLHLRRRGRILVLGSTPAALRQEVA